MPYKTLYIAHHLVGLRVEKVQATRETEKCYWVETKLWGSNKTTERRLAKSGSRHKAFDNFEDAKQYLLANIQRQVEAAENALKMKQKRLSALSCLTEEELK